MTAPDLRSDETKMEDARVQRNIAHERERCALIAERFQPDLDDPRSNQEQLAALIRGHS